MINEEDRRRGAVGRRRPRQVPIELAERIVAERDRVAAELERVRREKARVEDALRAAKVNADDFKRRASAAEQEADELRAAIASESPDDVEQEEVVRQLEDRIARLSADLDRMRKRTGTEVEGARMSERARILSGIGQVIDSVDRALRSTDDDNPWKAGLEAIRSQLEAFLHGEGASLTGRVGDRMDPRLHEAVSMIDEEGRASGEIVRVERRGIELEDGTVARTAQVVVAS